MDTVDGYGAKFESRGQSRTVTGRSLPVHPDTTQCFVDWILHQLSIIEDYQKFHIAQLPGGIMLTRRAIYSAMERTPLEVSNLFAYFHEKQNFSNPNTHVCQRRKVLIHH